MHLFKTLKQTNLDIRILWASVFLRMASYGLTNQILALYLKKIKISEFEIGLFMTLTLVGDTVISYFLTWNADRIGRRKVMLIGSIMMLASGIVFTYSTNFYILLAAAIIGVISPSGDETGPFKSVEEASMAHLTPHNHRPEVFAFYGLFSTAGAAAGSLICGFLVDYMNLELNWSLKRSYQSIFILYSGIAVLKFILMSLLSEKCEVHVENFTEVTEQSTLLESEEEDSDKSTGLSNTTRHYLPRLLIIFMLDSLGYGFMPSAWVVYYLKFTFELTAKALGILFFVTNSVDAVSSLPSAHFAKFFGPVKAILFTQAPSAIFFSLVAVTQSYPIVAALLLLYYLTSTMDVVPRQVLLTSIMPKEEITKVMGIVNIGKTFARCVGPIFTGKLAEHSKLRYGFIINGACVLFADVVLAINFLHIDHDILLKQRVDQNIE
ncbi:uncharacterized protein CPAR2_100280 [Candida parapsilosis]|uniref:MFS domain-containing protein n=1 Tax=Candida parapsilosis (strain CDC 317 / ATCC MYA-4646) TaxID=578454 RepID=G8B6A9_CANPC|nr:uncharacterized protein CPAR2_100280 [Candida parapsilosis]CCE39990.1 hypothetical protein CPAR2_100280 [Candida parapsilosis]